VRGGWGYIEDWADPRVVRDAHLGSIWEGTSNIVALDVLRAIRREAALPKLREHLQRQLAEAPLHAQARAVFERTIDRAAALAERAAEARDAGELLARQAASALYHVTTATAMAWEAGQLNSARRMHLAQLVLRQRVLPQDPLGGDDAEPAWLPALLDAARDDGRPADVNLF
jgi:acyl-CoA dehydrogenase